MVQSMMSHYEKSRERWLKKKEKGITDEERKDNALRQKDYSHRNKDKLKQYRKEIREINIEKGLCSECGKEIENKRWKTCSECRKYHREKCSSYKRRKS